MREHAPATDRQGVGHEDDRATSRLAALLRVSRRLASEADTRALLTALLEEAVAHLHADAGTVHRWDERRGGLVAIYNTLLPGHQPLLIPVGRGAVGQVAAHRTPVTIDDYQQEANIIPAAKTAGARAAIAVPLLHQNRLLGVLGVFSRDPARRFSAADLESLELLGSMAAAVLVGNERARLDGVLLAARTAQHELSNLLALTMGYTELLYHHPALPAELREAASESLSGIEGAVQILEQLARLSQVTETDWGPGLRPTIDLTER